MIDTSVISPADPAIPAPLHPFYPLSIKLPGYIAVQHSCLSLLTIFFAALALALAVTYLGMVKYIPAMRSGGKRRYEVKWMLWFMTCGLIHVLFEGYFGLYAEQIPASTSLRAEMWKMYSLSDSRYIANDTFTRLMESCTAIFWGPLSFLLVCLIATRHPLRHPIQIIVSLGQLYGLILYYGIAIIDEIIDPLLSRSRPERIYYWGFFIGLNAPWGPIPAYAIYLSTLQISKAIKFFQDDEDLVIGEYDKEGDSVETAGLLQNTESS